MSLWDLLIGLAIGYLIWGIRREEKKKGSSKKKDEEDNIFEFVLWTIFYVLLGLAVLGIIFISLL